MQFRSESIVDFKLAQMQSACVLKTTTCNIEKTLIDMRREMNIYKTVWRATIRQSTVIDDALTAATNSRLHNKQNQWHCCRRRLLLLTAGSDIEHHRWLICDVEVGYLLVRLQLSSGSRQQMPTDGVVQAVNHLSTVQSDQSIKSYHRLFRISYHFNVFLCHSKIG